MSFFCTKNWISKDELTELRAQLQRYDISADKVSTDPKVRYIHSIAASDIPCVKKLAIRALEYVQSQTSDEELGFSDTRGAVSLITASPGVELHQWWHRDTPFKSYAACIPLVDVTEHNGCTEILMQSTRTPASCWRRYMKDMKRVVCGAGSIYVFDARLLHRGTMNRSTQNRPVLFISITKPSKSFCGIQTNWEPSPSPTERPSPDQQDVTGAPKES